MHLPFALLGLDRKIKDFLIKILILKVSKWIIFVLKIVYENAIYFLMKL